MWKSQMSSLLIKILVSEEGNSPLTSLLKSLNIEMFEFEMLFSCFSLHSFMERGIISLFTDYLACFVFLSFRLAGGLSDGRTQQSFKLDFVLPDTIVGTFLDWVNSGYGPCPTSGSTFLVLFLQCLHPHAF